jgi:hypothetical protein
MLLALALTACTEQAQPVFSLQVRVESDPGTPLPGAVLSRAGKQVGQSDAQGLIPLHLSGALGESLTLDVSCPSGFRAPGKPLTVSLRSLIDDKHRPEYRVTCAPELRNLVVTVRAPLAVGVPLRYLGKEVARTDQDGTAHALLRLPPGESVDLLLDTSAPEHEGLRPQNPELKLVVPERDDVVLFEQQFRLEQKAEPKARRARPKGPTRI